MARRNSDAKNQDLPDDDSELQSEQVAEQSDGIEPAPMDLGSISVLIPPTQAGDASSRERLMRELQTFLETVARRHMDPTLKHKTGVSDIVQLSFLQVIENFGNFRGKTSAELRAWINTIVANEVNGVRRKYRTAKRDYTQEKSIEPKSSTAAGNVPADAHLTPSSAALQAERQRVFHETLAKLSEEHADVIRLRNIERLSFKEIGEKMGRSENAASKLWYRAILQFEERLRADDLFDGDS